MLPVSVKRAIFLGLNVALLAAVFVVGVYLGYSNRPPIDKITVLFNKETTKPEQIDFTPFWSAWHAVEEKYVGRGQLDTQKMVWGAIEGMVHSLGDPYSVFFPPKEAELFESSVKGEFSGHRDRNRIARQHSDGYKPPEGHAGFSRRFKIGR